MKGVTYHEFYPICRGADEPRRTDLTASTRVKFVPFKIAFAMSFSCVMVFGIPMSNKMFKFILEVFDAFEDFIF